MSDILEQIMGVDEASKVWGLNPGYIKILCGQGDVKARKVGTNWIIDKNQPNPSKMVKRRKKKAEIDSMFVKQVELLPLAEEAELTTKERKFVKNLIKDVRESSVNLRILAQKTLDLQEKAFDKKSNGLEAKNLEIQYKAIAGAENLMDQVEDKLKQLL